MKTNTISPTPYHDVNEISTLLLSHVREILKDSFLGMYLFGSLANGDFDDHSDIDVLIVTTTEISSTMFPAMQEMHDRLNAMHSIWANQLEVSYIPRDALQRFDENNNVHPHMDRGPGEKLHMMMHAQDWIVQRHMLRERGVIIAGPGLQTLIDPVSPNELRQAVVDVLPLWASPVLDDPSQISKRGYQSFVVLSLCRMLYTMKHSEIISKPLAAEWAKQNLGEQRMGLIERAWLGRQTPGLDAHPEDIDGTLDLIRYTVQYSNQIRNHTD